MANTDLQLVIRAVDEATATLQKARAEVQQFANGANSSLKSVEDSSRRTQGTFSAFMQVFGAQQAFGAVKSQMGAATEAANQMSAALMGLSVAAQASGVGAAAATQAAQSLAADGLMSVSDAALGLKNLLATGYGLDQATQIMNIFKDSAAFGRQAALGFGQSIVGATEGIKNQNEILLDNAGISTNATNLIKRNGGAMTDFGNIAQDAGTRVRLLTGLQQEHAASMGNAARYSQTFAGSQAQLGAQLTQVRAQMGALLESALLPYLNRAVEFVSKNQQMVIALGLSAAAVVTVAGAIIGLVAIVGIVSSVMGAFTIPLLAVSAILGVVLYGAIRKVLSANGDMFKNFSQGMDGMLNTAKTNIPGITDQQKKMNEQLEDISRNVLKANRDFAQSLADIVKTSQDKIGDLTKQVNRETADFTKNQQQKADDFKASQAEQLASHQERVDEIQKQLDEENAKGRFADATRLADLQSSLVKENDAYSRSTAEKSAAYARDVADATAAHDQKVSDLQASLNEEQGFLARHSDVLKGIRASDAKDQIDKLVQSHNDQMAEFDRQRTKIRASGVGAANDYAAAINSAKDKMDVGGFAQKGVEIGKSFARQLFDEILRSWANMVNSIGSSIGNAILNASGLNYVSDLMRNMMHNLKIPGYAAGGIVTSPTLAMVGEGSGPEAIIPLNNPQRANQIMQEAGLTGGGGVVIHQTNHNYSPYDLEAANRDLGYRLAMGAS